MFGFLRPKVQQAPFDDRVLNQLETRLERLEMDNAERQIVVLNLVEKVTRQLGARERKRERDMVEDGSDSPMAGVDSRFGNGGDRVPQPQPAPFRVLRPF